MSSSTQTIGKRARIAAAQATPKRVRVPASFHQGGCWWDLRYPSRAK
jgi:hypothetical protein